MPRTILLVDDSPTIRSIVKVYLMGQGYDFVDAENGERALQVARLVSPTLVIVDINMPGMNGLEFLKELRADEKLRAVPVILMTGDRSEELRAQALEAKADAFVYKPVTATALIEAVKRASPVASKAAS